MGVVGDRQREQAPRVFATHGEARIRLLIELLHEELERGGGQVPGPWMLVAVQAWLDGPEHRGRLIEAAREWRRERDLDPDAFIARRAA